AARGARRVAAARSRACDLGVLLRADRARALGRGRRAARRGGRARRGAACARAGPGARARGRGGDRRQGRAARGASRRGRLVSGPLIRARAVERRFGDYPALTPTDLDVEAGETLALVGPNGAGKSTLLALLAGALEPSGGTVERREGVRVGWAPQRPAQYGR